MRRFTRDIGQRHAIHIDAHFAQFMRDEACAQIHGARRTRGPCLGHLLKCWAPLPPIGRAHTLHASALLIDQDRGVAPHGCTQIRGQRQKLRGIFDIAGKQDKAPRLSFGEKTRLIGGEARAFATQDRGRKPGHARYLTVTGMQGALRATKAAQNRREAARSSNPWARRR